MKKLLIHKCFNYLEELSAKLKNNKKKIILTILTLLFMVSRMYDYIYLSNILAVLDLVILWKT